MEDIKQKIRELVPDAGKTFGLAVVLRAIEKKDKFVAITARGHFMLVKNSEWVSDPPHILWNLEHDNYDAQSQETKDLIGNLLGI